MSYIGALGVNTFDDEIEDANNILVDRIVSDINYTSNYVWTTSNILATRINDTSNILATRIKDTSNVLATRIKALEGTEGTPGDISLGIPPIPSTGGFATAAAIAALIAATYVGDVSVLSMLASLEIKVDENKSQADKIGGWSSNYSDKVGVWGSNYTEKLTSATSLIDKFSANDFSLINNKIFPLQALGYYSILVRNRQATYSYINATTGLTVNVKQAFVFSYNDRISNGSGVVPTNKETNPYIYANYNSDPSYNKYKVYYNDGDKIMIKMGNYK
jgi:hypothetical protein